MRQPVKVHLTADGMDSPEEVGNRLFKIRHVAGFGARGKQKEYADALGFEYDSYNQWERGRGARDVPVMCPVQAAVTICEHHDNNVTLDYIYRNRFNVEPAWSLPLKAAPDRPGFVKPTSPPRVRPPPRRRR